MDKGCMGCLFWALGIFTDLSTRYKRISDNPESKANTSYFAVRSIITTVVTGALFVLVVFGLFALFNALDDGGLGFIMKIIGVIALAAAMLVLFAEYVFGGLLGVIYQFRCNRKAMSWISLVVFIIATVAMIVGILAVVNRMSA